MPRPLSIFIKGTLGRVIPSLREYGFRKTGSLIWKNIDSLVRQFVEHRFDKYFDVDTTDFVELDALNITTEDKQHAFQYEPTPIRTFRRMLASLPCPLNDFMFVDFGSGKGRLRLAATEFGFKRIIGVEISEELCNIAKTNIKSFENKTGEVYNIEVVYTNAKSYSIPNDNCVLFFFNPFDRHLTEQVAQNIKAQFCKSRKKIFLLFYNPKSADVFDTMPFLKKIKSKKKVFDMGTSAVYGYAIYENITI